MERDRETSRRHFCTGAVALLLARPRLPGESAVLAPPGPADPFNALHPDVASIDHDRILAAAAQALQHPPAPITSVVARNAPGSPHDYFSEFATGSPDDDQNVPAGRRPFTAHRDAVLNLGLAVGALVATQLITGERRYSDAAALILRDWFVTPETRMTPALEFAQVPVGPVEHPASHPAPVPPPPTLGAELAASDAASATAAPVSPQTSPSKPSIVRGYRQGSYTGLVETLPLVEVVQALPFLAASGSLTSQDLAGIRTWFSSYLTWLTAEQESGPRLPALARDSRDHNATSWLLQVTAYRLFTLPLSSEPAAEDRSMTELRHRFRSVALRTQVSADGVFRNEVDTPNPYRNSLFNLDMMACLCNLLSTRFENVWEFQLEDGPGMRAAIAFHYPFIADRSRWPYRADVRLFSELPSRRASLLLSARAYQRPEYATLWKSLAPDPPSPNIVRTIPVHQPLLWVTPPPARA